MGEIESLTRCGTQRGGEWTGLLLNDVILDFREDRIREGFLLETTDVFAGESRKGLGIEG